MSKVIINLNERLGRIAVHMSYEKDTPIKDINAAIATAYLEYTGNNLSKTSRLLGVSRQTIYNWVNDETS